MTMLTVFMGCALLGGAALLALYVGPVRTAPLLHGLVGFAAFFGLGGLLASWLGLHSALQLASALLAGLAVGGVTSLARLLAGRPAPTLLSGSLVGRTGRVLLSPQEGAPGQVVVSTVQQHCLPARSRDRLLPGDRVLVVADASGLLDVLRWDG